MPRPEGLRDLFTAIPARSGTARDGPVTDGRDRGPIVTPSPKPPRPGYPPTTYGGVRLHCLCPDDPKVDGAAE
jgi:hypothetical protein